ncbi:MAG: polysaccharide deacetylase family protein [Conexibacter sp.]|nr:polysaccharide deacetylase family protein [Conexibacter sp.]
MRLAVAVVVAPGGDPEPALAALAVGGIGDAAVVELVRPGAWAAARNSALEHAGDVDVLALVDHDVRVDPGWAAALRAAWEAPGAQHIGAVGGPLRGQGAPPWLVGDHAEVLALHEGVDRPGPFPGGNVAFRTAALRGVGGFFPARGHAAARDTVGEDRRAQRELEAAGWLVVAVPGMGAARDLSGLRPADLVRRRLHTGARTATLGGTRRIDGLSLLGRAGAAAAARMLRGDRQGAVDRAAWAAHGAGGVLGRPLAHAGLQPDRASTALRPDVAPAEPHPWAPRRTRRLRPAGRVHGAILLYHRVAEVGADPLALAVTPEHFAEQLAVLRERWSPAPLAAVADGSAGDQAVAITFDDGYHDNLLHALPALAAAEVPATLFASTGHVATGEGYWWDAVTTSLASSADGVLELDLPDGRRAWAPAGDEQRAAVAAHVHAALRTRDHATITAAVAALHAWAGAPETPVPADRDRPMTVEELRELAAAGPFDVQAHGRTHLSLAHAPAASRDAELRGGADDLALWLGARPTVFSYPFGVPGVDVDEATKAATRAVGYVHATVNAPGLVRSGTDPHALPRLAVPDVDGPAFARWLHAVFPGR